MKRLASLVVMLATLSACSEGADRDAPPGDRETEAGSPSPSPTPPESSRPPRDLSAKAQRDLDERLIDAVWADDVALAERLIARGADVNRRDDTVQNAFLIAASEGYLDLLELTLESGANVRLHDGYDGTATIRAAERGHWDIVGRLLQTRLRRDIDHVNDLGWVALHEAIILGEATPDDVTTVRVLVAGGADLTIRSARDGVTPIDHARSRAQTEVVETLERALGPEPRDPDTALLAAAASGDADAAAVAIRAGADLETRDAAGRTPLLLAVTSDRLEVARLLIALGASPDALDGRHDTPWLITGVTGSVPMADLLLRYEPDLTIRNRYGGLSIIPASERGHVEYVRRVARTAIDLDHVNDLGWTALLEAVILGDGSSRYQEIVRILLAAGADPEIADSDGTTALEHARSSGQDEVARILARAGRSS